jgi:hypothetical protein
MIAAPRLRERRRSCEEEESKGNKASRQHHGSSLNRWII